MKCKVSSKQIIREAILLMRQYGYHQTSIAAVMGSVNLGKGSFQNYYRSKEDMAIEALTDYMLDLVRLQEEILTRKKWSPLKRIHKFYSILSDDFKDANNFKGGCLLGNLGMELGGNSHCFRRPMNLFVTLFNIRFAECIRQGQRTGEIQSAMAPMDLAELMFCTWEGAIWRMKTRSDNYSLDMFHNEFLPSLKSM